MNLPTAEVRQYRPRSTAEPSQGEPVKAVEEDYTFYGESLFQHMLRIERQRTERSKRPFLLALLDISSLMSLANHQENLEKIKSALTSALRETDIRGWYENDSHRDHFYGNDHIWMRTSIEGVFRKIFMTVSARNWMKSWSTRSRSPFTSTRKPTGGISINSVVQHQALSRSHKAKCRSAGFH